nr:PREDICTED: uncharacterized protein LOC106703451 [Latimeria chalumnae]|eukprot:XP_014343828.1 PREDICTED: uncharacterized protein LOC106703451 [Latimeria chalumnae]
MGASPDPVEARAIGVFVSLGSEVARVICMEVLDVGTLCFRKDFLEAFEAMELRWDESRPEMDSLSLFRIRVIRIGNPAMSGAPRKRRTRKAPSKEVPEPLLRSSKLDPPWTGTTRSLWVDDRDLDTGDSCDVYLWREAAKSTQSNVENPRLFSFRVLQGATSS